jgi:asparagine synthase (glutamine-hydrolysing)
MCGIAGQIYADPGATADGGLVHRMCQSIRYRGPDDHGLIVDGQVALGMVRLAIIDLVTGKQPMTNEDNSVMVVFNGEIYNFRELRASLEKNGYRFRTNSDTEVIVYLYEQYGQDFVHHLRGMFAIALWDKKERKFLLVRDRLGVKPLFYRMEGHRLLFGSEIKAILQDPRVPRVANYAGIDQMFRYGHTVPPVTCFDGIAELPPASMLTYHEGACDVRRYWDLHFEVSPAYDEARARDELLSLLRESIRLRMISDVPLGALLSGGVDSTMVVALMSEVSGAPVKTFSIGFEDRSYSELPYAKQVAERYGTDHHEYFVTPDVADLLPTLIRHHDAPFFDTSAIPTYYVCKMAREHVTVALSGDGGDELFAGYNLYLAEKAARYVERLPRWLGEGMIRRIANCIPESTNYLNKGRVAREFVRAATLGTKGRYERWSSKVKSEVRRDLYRAPPLVSCLNDECSRHIDDLFQLQPKATTLNRLLYIDIKTELANDVLVKVDRMSMANSLEVRSPLLDHRLHEFAATLPDEAKLKGWKTKYLLKSLAVRYLPRELLKRPKRGFSVPLDRWFREDLGRYAAEVVTDPGTRTRGLFNTQAVDQLMKDHRDGLTNYGREIWMLLVTELWHRMYIDSFQKERDSMPDA